MTSLVQISSLGSCDTRAPTNVSLQHGFANLQEDILSQVFLLLSRDEVSYSPNFGKDKWDWASVSEVCRYWYVVATQNSKLWSFLDLDQFYWTKRFQLSLRLSKNADLTICYNSDFEDVEFVNLKIALKEMWRIGHLELAVDFSHDQVAELLPYLELPAPRMQTVSIGTSAFNALSRSHFPFRSPGVSLKILLERTNLPSWLSGQTHLSELRLYRCNFFPLELLSILKASSALKVLYLAKCEFDSDILAGTQSAYLPHLEAMRLYNLQMDVAFGILRMIDAPNLSFLGLKCRGKLKLENIEKLGLFSRLIRKDYQADELAIETDYSGELEDDSSHFNVVRHQRTLDFLFCQPDRNPILQHLINISRRHLASLSVLEVSVGGNNVSTETWRSVYEACTSAKVFRTTLLYRNPDNGALSESPARMPYIEELGRSFPDLEHLVVTLSTKLDGACDDPGWFISLMTDLLERRLANGLPVCKVTVRSGERICARSDCVFHNGLEEIGALIEWTNAFARTVREMEVLLKYDDFDFGDY